MNEIAPAGRNSGNYWFGRHPIPGPCWGIWGTPSRVEWFPDKTAFFIHPVFRSTAALDIDPGHWVTIPENRKSQELSRSYPA